MINEEPQEVLHANIAAENQVDVPLALDLECYAIPAKKRRIFHELLLIQVQNMLSKHPEARCERPISKVFNVI